MGQQYCSKFWSQQLDPTDLSKLVAAKELYAEVILPYTDTQAKAFVCKVISDVDMYDSTQMQDGNLTVFTIHVPVPLLCLSTYAQHFGFTIADGTGKDVGAATNKTQTSTTTSMGTEVGTGA